MIKLWHIPSGVEFKSMKAASYVNALAFSPDGKTLASANEKQLTLWEVPSGKKLRILSGHKRGLKSLVFTPGGKTVITGKFKKICKGKVGGGVIKEFGAHTSYVSALAISPDGKTLASGSKDYKLKFWDTANGKLLKTVTDHKKAINTLAFSADGKLLAAGDSKKTIILWGR